MTSVELRSIRKGYGNACVVYDASCSFGPGIHLIEGANGTGKTTLLDIMTGLLEPTSGNIFIGGLEFARHRRRILSRMAFSPAQARFFDGVSVEFAVKLYFSLRGLSVAHDVFCGFDPFGLRRYETANFGSLSLGWQKRVVLHMVLAANADVLILDEPTIGLDIHAVEILGKWIRHREASGTTILTCHDPDGLALPNLRRHVLEEREGGSVLVSMDRKEGQTPV
jgi:ABC-2 type transport system ATP-binding protein